MIATENDKKIIKSTLLNTIKTGSFEGKRVVIFGCTIYARDIRDFLKNYGITVDAIVDNNVQKAGNSCLGVKVYLPKEYLIPNKKETLVIICSKYNFEMIEQLKSMGYQEEINILNIPVYESQSWADDSLEELNLAFSLVNKGFQVYIKLKDKYSPFAKVFLCPYPGTGDIYMACAFLKTYLQNKSINNYILIVGNNSCKKTAELFQLQNICVVDIEEIRLLLKAWEFLGTEKMDLKPLLYWGWRTKRFLYADEHPQITFSEMFRYDVFGFNKDALMCRPQSHCESKYAHQLFEKLNLPAGKTVIIAPYAGSFVSEISLEIWEKIVQGLLDRGYKVCTNCYGKKEKNIKNTIPIIFPYEEAVNVLEYAGGFIAVRSGLCDIVSTAKCKMLIIYEKGFNASRYEYFSLQKMGLNKSVHEINFDSNIIDRVLENWV